MEQRTAGSNPSIIPDSPLLPIKHPPPPPASAGNIDDPPPSPPPPPPPPPLQSSPLTSSDAQKPSTLNETYVIQVPKDQIYRVPPPQNARIVRQHLKSSDNRARQNKSCRLSRWWCWVLLAATILAAILGAVYVVLTGAENPQFSLVRVVAWTPPPSAHQSKPPKFEISLKARNPNDRIGIWYEEDKDATAKLSLKKQSFASGRFPGGFYQETKNTTVVHFAAVGRIDAKLPPEVQRSATDKNSTAKVAGMVLAVDVPIRMVAGSLRAWKMDVRVHCTFSVSTLTSSGRVSSQDCRTTR